MNHTAFVLGMFCPCLDNCTLSLHSEPIISWETLPQLLTHLPLRLPGVSPPCFIKQVLLRKHIIYWPCALRQFTSSFDLPVSVSLVSTSVKGQTHSGCLFSAGCCVTMLGVGLPKWVVLTGSQKLTMKRGDTETQLRETRGCFLSWDGP